MPWPAGALAAGLVDKLADRAHRGRQVGAGVRQFQVVDFLADDAPPRRPAGHDHPRRRGHQHQREGVALRTLLDDLRGQLLGPVETALVGRPIGHGIGAVDHQHAMRRPAAAGRQRAAVQIRLGHRQHHQHDQQRAEGQQAAIARREAGAAAARRPPADIPSPPRTSRGTFAGSTGGSGSAQPPPPASRASAGWQSRRQKAAPRSIGAHLPRRQITRQRATPTADRSAARHVVDLVHAAALAAAATGSG